MDKISRNGLLQDTSMKKGDVLLTNAKQQVLQYHNHQ